MELIKKYWMITAIVVLFGVIVFQQFALFKLQEKINIVVAVLDNQGEYILGIIQTPEVRAKLQELSNQ